MSKASSALAVRSIAGQEVVTHELIEKARGFAAAAKSARTRTEYRRDWARFTAWAEANRLKALPASATTLALYLTSMAEEGFKVASIMRALAAISAAHKAAGVASPRGKAEVQEVVRGIRRTLGVAQVQKAPLLAGNLRAVVMELPTDALGLRDRALLLLGFSGAFRRSELVALDVADLAFTDDGLEITIRRSKTDQEGAGRKIGIPLARREDACPVRSVRAWLEAAQIQDGAVFRPVNRHGRISGGRLTGRSVARIVKRSVELAGLEPAKFSGHSLRAGLVTSAAKAGKPVHAIMRQTGHRSLATVERYIRDASLFNQNAAEDLL